MVRRLAVGAAAVLLAIAGFFLWKSMTIAAEPLPTAPPKTPYLVAPSALPDAPAASERTREEKRFDRYDKDRDARITREEYLASRRKAWAKLDTNGDGRLGFEEWSAKTADKFASADADRSGMLDRAEFVATRGKRSAAKRCACPSGKDDGD